MPEADLHNEKFIERLTNEDSKWNIRYRKYVNSLTNEEILKQKRKWKFEFNDMPKIYQEIFLGFSIAHIKLSTDTKPELVAEYFRLVQNQDKLRAGEIATAFPNSKFDQILRDIDKDIINLAENKWHFEWKRKEFQKLYITVIGCAANQIALGGQDKEVIKFLSKNIHDLSSLGEINRRIKDFKEYLNNYLESTSLSINLGKSWKRFIKIFLILFFVWERDLNDAQIQQLTVLNEMLAVIASDKYNEETKKTKWNEIFNELEFPYEKGYDIWTVFRGRKKVDVIKEHTSFLNNWINKWN